MTVGSIGILRNLPNGFSSKAAKEIEKATTLPWQENSYREYTSQGYEAVSLFNKGGDSSHTIIEDCKPIPTPELMTLRNTRNG